MDGTQKAELVDALLACPTMRDQGIRNIVVNELPNDLKNTIQRSSTARTDVSSIVTRCLDFVTGIELLINIVRGFEGDSLPMREVDEVWTRISDSEATTKGQLPDEPALEPEPTIPPADPTQPAAVSRSSSWFKRIPGPVWWFVPGFLLTLVLIAAFFTPFRCVLQYRISEAIVGLIALLAGAIAAVIVRYAPSGVVQGLSSVVLGIAVVLLGGVILHVIMVPPPEVDCTPPSMTPITPTPPPSSRFELDDETKRDEGGLSKNQAPVHVLARVLGDQLVPSSDEFEHEWSLLGFNPIARHRVGIRATNV